MRMRLKRTYDSNSLTTSYCMAMWFVAMKYLWGYMYGIASGSYGRLVLGLISRSIEME